jgi:hypothetical protein
VTVDEIRISRRESNVVGGGRGGGVGGGGMRGSGSRSVVGRCGCGGGFGRQAVSARGGLLHHPLRGMFRHGHQNNNGKNNNNELMIINGMVCLGLLRGEPHEEDGVCGQLGRFRVAVNANENHWTFVCFFLSAAAKLVLDRGIQMDCRPCRVGFSRWKYHKARFARCQVSRTIVSSIHPLPETDLLVMS